MNFSDLKNKLSFLTDIKISSKNKISFLGQLSNLLNSGIPITNALQIMSYQSENKKIKEILKTTISNINK
jgi:type II secretory pathway component PulF